jgi:hypothetical protein
MKQQQRTWRIWASVALVFALAGGTLSTLGGRSSADEKIGKVQQPLVGGREVSESDQERLGLLTYRDEAGSCSASLLRNDWVVLAAHCVESTDDADDPIPDPDRPGQNKLVKITKAKLTANWGGGQTQTAVRIETFRPYDVAIIQLFDPIKVNNRTVGFARQIYLGDPKGVNIEYYGRGLSKFATGSGASATPAEFDNKFRVGEATVSEVDGEKFWYSGKNGEMTGGGDSGGPSFTAKGELVGVHSTARGQYVMGKPKQWKWATKTTEASDAPVAPVWRQIAKIIGPVQSSNSPEPAPPPEPVFQYTVPIGNVNVSSDFHVLYGVKQDGTLMWQRHEINPGSRRPHTWVTPTRVGDGWKAGVQNVYPAGQNAIYTLSDNGDLRWFWHTGVLDGSYRWREPSQLVGTGWNEFAKIVPMDKGVIYGIYPNGDVRWHRHLNYMTGQGGTGDSAWAKSKLVQSGFDKYRTVFGGGNGVLYAVGNDGKLYWYRHKDYVDKPAILPVNLPKGLNAKTIAVLKNIWTNSWEGPKVVGDGWDTPLKLFSPGEGHIYAIMPNGDLMYYRHTGWQNGTYVWDENIKAKIATGWNAYVFAFARNDTSDAGSGNPEVDFQQPK